MRRAMPSPLKVLVVEDDEQNLQYFLCLLQSWCYQAEGARSAQQALASIRGNCPDVIMSDLIMPGMSGMDLLQAIRDIPDCKVYFILITGFGTVNSLVHAIEEGADECLLKPVLPENLHVLLQRYDAQRVKRDALA